MDLESANTWEYNEDKSKENLSSLPAEDITKQIFTILVLL